LGIVFLISVVVLQFVFQQVTGGQQSTLALAVSTLVIGALFQPIRNMLRRFVDRRLYGIKVSYSTPPANQIVWVGPAGELTGSKLGAYQVEEHLGRGGMSDVYRGRHITIHRQVAIKVLPAIYAKEADFRHRFEREADTISKLEHPNIVQMYDSGEQDGMFYMVMEYIKGPDLADRIRQRAPMPLVEAKMILADVASALDYAHVSGVVHRDIKPSNVMLQQITGALTTGIQRAVLMDFGIARIMDRSTRITGSGIIGTFDYMAPEQIGNSGEVDGRADIYALGVVAFQMLTGRLPFPAGHPGAVLIAHLQQPPPDPQTLRPDLPGDTAEALLRILEKDPARRFQSAGDFIVRLG
jgi:eukaryotic-like serine/threonine-protein kinase